MVAGVALALLMAAASGGAGTEGPGPRIEGSRVGVSAGAVAPIVEPDTTKPRRKAFQLSEAYETRLKIHKYASYATLPLFAAQYAAGDQLMKKSSAAPAWARNGHGALATAVAGLFVVNTITGSLNWWETREQEGGRAWRTAHAALMLLADAGFAYTGVLADEAEGSGSKRKLHKKVALTSISVSTLSYVMMLSPFRRD